MKFQWNLETIQLKGNSMNSIQWIQLKDCWLDEFGHPLTLLQGELWKESPRIPKILQNLWESSKIPKNPESSSIIWQNSVKKSLKIPKNLWEAQKESSEIWKNLENYPNKMFYLERFACNCRSLLETPS